MELNINPLVIKYIYKMATHKKYTHSNNSSDIALCYTTLWRHFNYVTNLLLVPPLFPIVSNVLAF